MSDMTIHISGVDPKDVDTMTSLLRQITMGRFASFSIYVDNDEEIKIEQPEFDIFDAHQLVSKSGLIFSNIETIGKARIVDNDPYIFEIEITNELTVEHLKNSTKIVDGGFCLRTVRTP